MGTTTTAIRRKFEGKDLRIDSLSPFIDVVYGAVLSYGFFLISRKMEPLFQPGPLQWHKVNWSALSLLLFTTNFLVGDYAEARLFSVSCPPRRRLRFTCDLIIPLMFFAAYAGSDDQSPRFLLPIAGVLIFGAVWGLIVDSEYREEVDSFYPRVTVGTHTAAAVLVLSCWMEIRAHGSLGLVASLAAWGVYLVFCGFVIALKEAVKVPEIEIDLLPIYPVNVAARFCGRWMSRH